MTEQKKLKVGERYTEYMQGGVKVTFEIVEVLSDGSYVGKMVPNDE